MMILTKRLLSQLKRMNQQVSLLLMTNMTIAIPRKKEAKHIKVVLPQKQAVQHTKIVATQNQAVQ